MLELVHHNQNFVVTPVFAAWERLLRLVECLTLSLGESSVGSVHAQAKPFAGITSPEMGISLITAVIHEGKLLPHFLLKL